MIFRNTKVLISSGKKVLIALTIVMIAGCSTLESTSSAPKDREKFVSDSRCEKSLERMNNFVKYWPPSPSLATNYYMYKDGFVGFRGYDLLGDLYYFGCDNANLSPDKGSAAYWYLNAANGHVPEAQFKLGKMMYEGDGVKTDQIAGLNWLISSAMEKNHDARAYLFALGIDVPVTYGPNTYEEIQAELKLQKKQTDAAYWKGVFSDLLGVAILAGSTYLVLKATTPTYYLPKQTTPKNQVNIYRYKPKWCNSNFSALSTGSVITGTVSTFCY